jgi:hypothetical protein
MLVSSVTVKTKIASAASPGSGEPGEAALLGAFLRYPAKHGMERAEPGAMRRSPETDDRRVPVSSRPAAARGGILGVSVNETEINGASHATLRHGRFAVCERPYDRSATGSPDLSDRSSTKRAPSPETRTAPLAGCGRVHANRTERRLASSTNKSSANRGI